MRIGGGGRALGKGRRAAAAAGDNRTYGTDGTYFV